MGNTKETISLPRPSFKGSLSLEEVLLRRRSRRSFTKKPVSLKKLSQILWASQGVTGERWGMKLRAAPSAGALYPLEIYMVVGEGSVEELEAGVYHYLPEGHQLELTSPSDLRRALAEAAWGQEAIATAPASLLIAALLSRTTRKYGQRGLRYVNFEVGHLAQNVYLQAEALGLGTVAIGAFGDKAVAEVLNLTRECKPLYILPIGCTGKEG